MGLRQLKRQSCAVISVIVYTVIYICFFWSSIREADHDLRMAHTVLAKIWQKYYVS